MLDCKPVLVTTGRLGGSVWAVWHRIIEFLPKVSAAAQVPQGYL
jgi:hypothetical protein